MAGKQSAKGCVIAVDDSGGTPRTLSGDIESYEIEWAANPEDCTGFGEGSINYLPGQRVIGCTLNPFWNLTATTGATTVLLSIVGHATSKTLTVTPEAGGIAFSGEFMCDGITPSGEAAGGPIKLGSVHFSAMGAVVATFA